MGTRIYVGNLPYQTDEVALRGIFEAGGRRVVEVKIVTDRETGRSRGFGFVEMGTDEEARLAIEELNGRDFSGRPLTVNEARQRTPREGGGGGGGGGGGWGGGGGGGGGGHRGGRGRRGRDED